MNNETDALRFSEVISDFAALIQEIGAEEVWNAFGSFYPEQRKEVERSINKRKSIQQIPALLRAP